MQLQEKLLDNLRKNCKRKKQEKLWGKIPEKIVGKTPGKIAGKIPEKIAGKIPGKIARKIARKFQENCKKSRKNCRGKIQ